MQQLYSIVSRKQYNGNELLGIKLTIDLWCNFYKHFNIEFNSNSNTNKEDLLTNGSKNQLHKENILYKQKLKDTYKCAIDIYSSLTNNECTDLVDEITNSIFLRKIKYEGQLVLKSSASSYIKHYKKLLFKFNLLNEGLTLNKVIF